MSFWTFSAADYNDGLYSSSFPIVTPLPRDAEIPLTKEAVHISPSP